jgi:hypothetical protein
MRDSPEGLVPARGFLAAGMAPRPSFNDGSNQGERVFYVYTSKLSSVYMFCITCKAAVFAMLAWTTWTRCQGHTHIFPCGQREVDQDFEFLYFRSDGF